VSECRLKVSHASGDPGEVFHVCIIGQFDPPP
jgi:hypothetical protein